MAPQPLLISPCQTRGGMVKIGEGEAALSGAIRGAEMPL